MAIDAGYTITPLSGSGIQVQYSSDGETWHATFTDGDVYMRQKIDGGDWTDPIKIVGEDGKNAIVMTSATTPSGEYEGQVGIWQNQIYFWTNGAWVNQTPELPTDAVLHYSFDDIPDYPDGSNVYFFNQDFTTDWLQNTTYPATLTDTDGLLKIVPTSAIGLIRKSDFTVANLGGKIVKARVKVHTAIDGEFKIRFVGNIVNAEKIITERDKWVDFSVFISNENSGNLWLGCYFPSASSDNYIIYETLYIGDGSYSTPIIDNANGQNNAVNYGGIAVKGVSGKGIVLLNGKSICNSNFNLTPNFTISAWFKPDNITKNLNGLLLFKQNQIILRNGGNGNNNLLLTLYGINNNAIINQDSVNSLLPANEWTHIVIVRKGATCNVYINGKVTYTKSLANNTISNNLNDFVLGGNTLERITNIDDFQIFDRALSEKEVLALYQNKANTPKYFTLSDYNLEQIDDDNVVDHLTEKPQLLSKWLEIYNAKNVSSALPTSNVSTNGEYKGVINTANEVGVISTEQLTNYIQATNALRSALWGTNGYLVDMNTDSTLNGNLDSLFANYRETLQIARTQITQQQASIASALSVVNSNPFQLIPVNSQGEVITGGYDNTGTRLQVYNGTTVLTPKSSSAALSNNEWKVTVSGNGIVAGSQTVGTGDNKYIDFGNVSNMTSDSAVITYTISVMVNNTPNTIYVVQKFGKSKEGADGRIYTLLPDYTAVKKSADGSVLTPSSVTVQAKSWTGSSIPEPYSQGDLVALENEQQIASESLEHSITFNPTGNYSVVVNLYRHGTNTLIDTVTIPILQEVKGDTGRGLQSETSYYKLSANLTETFDSTTISTWTDSADSTPTAQKPYLHCAVLSAYTEEPTNVYGDDVIIREYVTNGTNGTSTRYSSASATSSTTSIALNTITGNTAVAGDVIIANSLLFVVTAVGSTSATVQYKQSIKGADNKSVTVLLSNQNPNVTSNSDGTSPVLTNTVTDIRVYENETELKYDASSTSNGYYKITVTASGCTHSSITDKGDYAQVNAISAMSADNATRTFAISGKRSDGTTFSFSAVQTITKSKKGNPTTISGTEIQYFQNQNGTVEPSDSENWSDTPPSQIAGYYLWTRTKVTYSDSTVVKSYSVTRNGSNGANGTSTRYSSASVTSSTTSIALSTITGGTAVVGDVVIAGSLIFSVTAVSSTNATVQYRASIKGEDNKSISVILSAPNVDVSCDSNGTPSDYTNTPTTTRVYQNTQELSYDGSGTSNGTWKATVSRSGCSGGSFTDSGVYATLGSITGMSADNASRTITITGKRADGTSFTTTVTQTLSKNKQGKGVVSVIAYTALSTDTTKPASSAFTITAKSVDSTNRYLWRYEVTTYTDNSTTGSYTDATIIGVWGNSGIDATSVSISSEQIEVMCGSGNGKFLGDQTQRITVYARKGSAKKACTLSFTSPASGTGITITKQNGTASADGYFNITFANNGNMGSDSTNSFDISLSVTVDGTIFNFTVKTVKASKGVYLGRCASKPSAATVTVYTGDTWNGSSATKYAQKGDYVSVVNMTESDSNRGKMFQWNGSQWNEDGNTGHAMEALDDMLLMGDEIPDGSNVIKFIRRLVVAEEFLHKLFVNKIQLITEGQDIGAIYGGKYLEDGTVDPETTTDKGVYMDATGEFKASNGLFSGTIQSENYIDADVVHYSYIKYRAWYGYRGIQYTAWYDTPSEAIANIYSEGTYMYTEAMFYDEGDNPLITDGKFLSYEANTDKGYIYTTDDIITQAEAEVEFNRIGRWWNGDTPFYTDKIYLWVKYINSGNTDYVIKCFCSETLDGYRLSDDGKVDLNGEVNINGHETVNGETTFNGDIEINGVERVNGHIEIQNSQYDTTRKNYIGVCSKNYNNDTCTGFNFGATNSNSYADVNHMNVRTFNGWKTASETYSKITFDANNFAFNGQRTYTNITANSYSPSSSSSQRSALFDKIVSIYDKIGGGYTHLGFKFGYNQSTTQQVIFSGSIYRIEKASDTVYRVHIYDEFGQAQENYLAVTSSSCIIRTEASGSQVSSSVSTVKFVSIN